MRNVREWVWCLGREMARNVLLIRRKYVNGEGPSPSNNGMRTIRSIDYDQRAWRVSRHATDCSRSHATLLRAIRTGDDIHAGCKPSHHQLELIASDFA